MDFAVCVWTLTEPEQTAEMLAAEGAKYVEIGPDFFLNNDESTIARAVRTLESNGVVLRSVHAPFGEKDDLSSLNPETRNIAIETLSSLMRKLSAVGVDVVIIHPGRHASQEQIPLMEEVLLESIAEVLPVAEGNRVRLALENMLPAHPGYKSEVIRRIVERFDSDWLGVCFDSGHAHVNDEGAITAFDNLKDLIIAFHLQDNDRSRDLHLQPPYGTTDWETLCAGIRQEDYPFPIAIEARPWNGVSFSLMLREIEALFKFGRYLVDQNGVSGHLICPECNRYIFRWQDGAFCGCHHRGD